MSPSCPSKQVHIPDTRHAKGGASVGDLCHTAAPSPHSAGAVAPRSRGVRASTHGTSPPPPPPHFLFPPAWVVARPTRRRCCHPPPPPPWCPRACSSHPDGQHHPPAAIGAPHLGGWRHRRAGTGGRAPATAVGSNSRYRRCYRPCRRVPSRCFRAAAANGLCACVPSVGGAGRSRRVPRRPYRLHHGRCRHCRYRRRRLPPPLLPRCDPGADGGRRPVGIEPPHGPRRHDHAPTAAAVQASDRAGRQTPAGRRGARRRRRCARPASRPATACSPGRCCRCRPCRCRRRLRHHRRRHSRPGLGLYVGDAVAFAGGVGATAVLDGRGDRPAGARGSSFPLVCDPVGGGRGHAAAARRGTPFAIGRRGWQQRR